MNNSVIMSKSDMMEKAFAFYRRVLMSDHGLCAREYLLRKFGEIADFVGYAPQSWDAFYIHLDASEILLASECGLIVPYKVRVGYYDRLRDRLVYPMMGDGGVGIVELYGKLPPWGNPEFPHRVVVSIL